MLFDAAPNEGAVVRRATAALWSLPLPDDDQALFAVTADEVTEAALGWEAHRGPCFARTRSGRRFETLQDRLASAEREVQWEDRRATICLEDAFLSGDTVGVGVRWRWLSTPRIYVKASSSAPDAWQCIGELSLARGGRAPLYELVDGADFAEAVAELAA